MPAPMGEIPRQRPKLLFPEAAVLLYPAGCLCERLGPQAASLNPALACATYEPRFLKNVEVLRHRGQRDPMRRRDLGDGERTGGEAAHDRPACRMRQRSEGAIQRAMAIFNHFIEYTPPPMADGLTRAGRATANRVASICLRLTDPRPWALLFSLMAPGANPRR